MLYQILTTLIGFTGYRTGAVNGEFADSICIAWQAEVALLLERELADCLDQCFSVIRICLDNHVLNLLYFLLLHTSL